MPLILRMAVSICPEVFNMFIVRNVKDALVVGLIQGVFIWWMLLSSINVVRGVLLVTVALGAFNMLLLGENFRERGTHWWVIGLTAVIGVITGWGLMLTGAGGDSTGWMTYGWIFYAIVINYICMAFILSWPSRSGKLPRYEDLFRHAWDTVFIMVLGVLMCAVFWFLMALCAAAFTMIGIPIFNLLFFTGFFIIVSSCAAIAVGIHIGRENHFVIGTLRTFLLKLCRFLLPLAALITLCFTFALPFVGLEPVAGRGYSTKTLLCLVIANVFLVNGVFQDGIHRTSQEDAYPVWLRLMVNVSLLCLPVLTLLAGYSLWLRIDEYGLTPNRFKASLLTVVMLTYSVAATWAVLAPQRLWLWSMRVSNSLIALMIVLMMLVINTPWFSPLQLSANNQVERLLSGKTVVENFDSKALRDFGQPGKQAYEALIAQVEQGQILTQHVRKELLERLEKSGTAYSDHRKLYTPQWIGPKVEGSDQFDDPQEYQMSCLGGPCVLWAVDLDQDGEDEVLKLDKRDGYETPNFFKRNAFGIWQHGGSYDSVKNALSMIKHIRQGSVKVVKPRYQSLQVEDEVLDPR